MKKKITRFSIIVLLFVAVFLLVGPFIGLGGSQLISNMTYNEKKIISFTEKILNERYKGKFVINKSTIVYNNPLKVVNLRAYPENSPQDSFLVEIYLSAEEKKFKDNYLLNRALKQAMKVHMNNYNFYYEGDSDDIEIYSEQTRDYFVVQPPKENEIEAINYLKNHTISLIFFTYFNVENKDNDVTFQQLYKMIDYFKEKGINLIDINVYFPKDITNIQQKVKYNEMISNRNFSSVWEMSNNSAYGGCFLPIKNINSKEDLLHKIKLECATLTNLIQ